MVELGISVVIPTYNRAHLIPRALNSALSSMGPNDEILVIDDASTDNTAQVVATFGDRVRYVLAPHGGAGAARNLGIRLATRELVAFLDSDDEWHADKVTLQRTFMQRRPDVLFCFSDFCSTTEGGEETRNFLKFWHKDSRSWDEILGPGVAYSSLAELPAGRADFSIHAGNLYLAEMESNYVATSTLVVRRIPAGSALQFAEDLPISEDKECFARLAGIGTAAYFSCETSIQWGHTGPRITDMNACAYYTSRLTLLDRIWGQDPAFVATHGARLHELTVQAHLDRARWYLVRGQMREARLDLKMAGKSPLSYRLLASVPGPLARTILALRRVVGSKTC